MAEQPESSGGKSLLGGCPDFPDPFECSAERQIYPPGGPMCCPPNRNGNMPAVRARPRRTHGVRQLPVRMRITGTHGADPNQTVDVGQLSGQPMGLF